jgi:hypothetical protein
LNIRNIRDKRSLPLYNELKNGGEKENYTEVNIFEKRSAIRWFGPKLVKTYLI